MRYTIMLIAAIALLTTFTACKDSDLTSEQAITAGCATVSAATKVLTAANDAGKLSAEAQQRVLQAFVVTDPVCRRSTPPTLDEAGMAAFQAAVTALQGTANATGDTPL